MAKKKTVETEQNTVPTYTKEQILSAKKYKNRRDALGVVLVDGETYTLETVDSLLETFMKGKVN